MVGLNRLSCVDCNHNHNVIVGFREMIDCSLIEISASPKYIPEESDPGSHKFIWSYEIMIINNSDKMIQLLNRCWLITDMTGKVEEIRGAGVIGLQPVIKPGKQFIYTSFCQLMLPQGTM